MELVLQPRRHLLDPRDPGALIGPLFGILIADYYLVRNQHVVVDDLFTLEEDGAYYYSKGYNPAAVLTVAVTGGIAVLSVVVPKLTGVLTWLPDYSWFLGCGLGFLVYLGLASVYGVDRAAAAARATSWGTPAPTAAEDA